MGRSIWAQTTRRRGGVAVGGVAHGEMPGARVACAHSQGGVVLVIQWACGWIGRGCDAWGGQVASAPAYGAAVGVVQEGAEVGDEGRAIS